MDRELFLQLEDVILNKGISVLIMLRAMLNLHNKHDLMLEYIMKSIDKLEEVVETFREIQHKYYEDLDG